MDSTLTPFQKLQKASSDYHEALNEVFSDEGVSLDTKAKLGGLLTRMLECSKEVCQIVRPLYE